MAPMIANLVFCGHERIGIEAGVKRRQWLTGCALAAGAGWSSIHRHARAASTPPEQTARALAQTHFLALFPLGLVAFPGEKVLLHVFEPRYRQLIRECDELGIRFGIVTLISGGASTVGTEMALERILRTDTSGNMDVETRGLRTFRLESFQRDVEDKLYSGGQVTYQRNDPQVNEEIQGALVGLYNRMRYHAGARELIGTPYPENLSFIIGHDVGLSRAQELRMLGMTSESDRQVYLFQHLLRTQ